MVDGIPPTKWLQSSDGYLMFTKQGYDLPSNETKHGRSKF